jgi:hypothetical protein
VCNVLKYWVSQHFDDFDHDLIQTVVNFVDESLAVDGHDSVTGVLRNAIVKRVRGHSPPQTPSIHIPLLECATSRTDVSSTILFLYLFVVGRHVG